MKSRYKYWVGLLKGHRIVFSTVHYDMPTPKSHPYSAVIGPFYTKRGAKFMAKFGYNNPHCRNVAEAEKLAKKKEVSSCSRRTN